MELADIPDSKTLYILLGAAEFAFYTNKGANDSS
jgi:hypothetical protein